MGELESDPFHSVTLTRRLRGYDRRETDELLARISEGYDHVNAERMRLHEEVSSLRTEQEERKARSDAELDKLCKQLSERDRQIADLETQISQLKHERSKQLDELAGLREELSHARAVQDDLEAESREHGERLARSALREKALVARIAMLVSQLEEGKATPANPREQRALPERAGRAAAMLSRLDRVVETLERETRQQAETTLKKARERADEIVHSAELRRRRLEAEPARTRAEEHAVAEGQEDYDAIAPLGRIEPSVTEPDVSEDLEREIGEASWTSRPPFGETQ